MEKASSAGKMGKFMKDSIIKVSGKERVNIPLKMEAGTKVDGKTEDSQVMEHSMKDTTK